MKIPKVVIGGGPCSGKTTCQPFLKEQLEKEGYEVFFVPETATTLLNAGAKHKDLTVYGLEFQRAMLRVQLAMEDAVEACAVMAAARGAHPVILYDRGLIDGEAYGGPLFHVVMRDKGLTKEQALDRYDHVFHLLSVAVDKPELYGYNNAVRYETVEQAAKIDLVQRQIWSGHKDFTVIDNYGPDFETKLYLLLDEILDRIKTPDHDL